MRAVQQSCLWQLIRPSRVNLWLPIAIFAWAAAVGISWRMILDYEFKAEATIHGETSARWPVNTGLTITPNCPTVLFFIHPKCPCTRASLAELERLWVLRGERVTNRPPQLIVVATVPPDASAEWLTTGTVERASKLPGATLVIDPEGREAQRFGATTSGTVLWFDEDGRRLYAGGITASRGHEGDNIGRTCLEELLRGSMRVTKGVPALGCRLCLPAGESSSQLLTGE
jgi:hypothetical protein